jgi:hypothetical protein
MQSAQGEHSGGVSTWRRRRAGRQKAAIYIRAGGGGSGGGRGDGTRGWCIQWTRDGEAARPDLNELDVPEWAELALDKVEWEATAAHRPREMETASRRQSATTRACGVRLGARRFSQRAQLTQRQSETCSTLDWPDTGRAWCRGLDKEKSVEFLRI